MGKDRNDLEVLDRRTCLELLRRHPTHIGRLALQVDGDIAVLPVNYRLDGEDVVFATNPGSKLDAAHRRDRVAFEVDAVDVAWEEGWSVLLQGRPSIVRDEDERARLTGRGLRAWVGPRSNVVRLTVDTVTGRRII